MCVCVCVCTDTHAFIYNSCFWSLNLIGFHFYINISVMVNDSGILFLPYFSQKLLETYIIYIYSI